MQEFSQEYYFECTNKDHNKNKTIIKFMDGNWTSEVLEKKTKTLKLVPKKNFKTSQI